MTYQIIIPARYASTRFPGKPLALIGDKPMIQHVYEQARKVVEQVYVATDDKRIFEAVEQFGGQAIMTSDQHRSGTDRICEAYQNINSQADVVINIQGDEPFIKPEQIQQLMKCFDNPNTQIATLVRPFKQDENIFDPNIVKVVISEHDHRAIYFSRSAIPYLRGVEPEQWLQQQTYYAHIGMYAYRANTLQQITRMPQSALERSESLEQLRWIEAGIPIYVGITEFSTIGIDTPEDLAQANKVKIEK